MDRSQIFGLVICTVSFVLMCCKQIAPTLHYIGIWTMTLGVLALGLHHLYEFARADRAICSKG